MIQPKSIPLAASQLEAKIILAYSGRGAPACTYGIRRSQRQVEQIMHILPQVLTVHFDCTLPPGIPQLSTRMSMEAPWQWKIYGQCPVRWKLGLCITHFGHCLGSQTGRHVSRQSRI